MLTLSIFKDSKMQAAEDPSQFFLTNPLLMGYSYSIPTNRKPPDIGFTQQTGKEFNVFLKPQTLQQLQIAYAEKKLGVKTNSSQRVLPPVPRFDLGTQKKQNTSINVNNMLDKKHLDQCQPLPSPFDSHSESKPQTLEYILTGSPTKQDSFSYPLNNNMELESNKKSAESTSTSDSDEANEERNLNDMPFDKLPLQIAKLDPINAKKVEKFKEFLQEYLVKLKIENLTVEQKYMELVHLTIPQLQDKFKSKPFEAIAAGLLLYACRESQYPITIKEIGSVCTSNSRIINKCIFTIKEIIPKTEEVRQFGAQEFIDCASKKLQLDSTIVNASRQVCRNLINLNFVKSIHAVTLAGCCIKFATDLSYNEKTFDEVSKAVGTTKVTLKILYRQLFPYRFNILKDIKLAKNVADLKNI